MIFSKILVASTLILSLVGTDFNLTKLEEQMNTAIQAQKVTLDVQNAEGNRDSDELPGLGLAVVADYENVGLTKGSYMLNFQIGTNDKDIRFSIKNRGSSPFSWEIFDPQKETWSKGTLTAGESESWTALGGSDYIPIGEYTFVVSADDGGEGTFDFSAKVLD